MKLKIKMMIEGGEREFESKFISAKMLRESNKMARRHIFIQPKDGETDVPVFEDMIDALADYMVGIYGDQFTSEQILGGMSSEDFQNAVYETAMSIMGKSEVSSEKSK